jgi:hypothetical protein
MALAGRRVGGDDGDGGEMSGMGPFGRCWEVSQRRLSMTLDFVFRTGRSNAGKRIGRPAR